jgi:hypothetical protein
MSVQLPDDVRAEAAAAFTAYIKRYGSRPSPSPFDMGAIGNLFDVSVEDALDAALPIIAAEIRRQTIEECIEAVTPGLANPDPSAPDIDDPVAVAHWSDSAFVHRALRRLLAEAQP